jgi:hypothetical protein
LDHAVALVQTYLQLNGYFTTAEYPVVEAVGNSFRSVTDIDVLAFRFPGAAEVVLGTGASNHSFFIGSPDPILNAAPDRIDLVIGEVKEGKVHLNSPVRDPVVLRSVLARFGCVERLHEVANELLARGTATTPEGYHVHIIVFGGVPRNAPSVPCKVISLGHVLKYLQSYVRTNWAMLRHIQFKDPAFSFLMTLEKARRGERRTRKVAVEPKVERRGVRVRPLVAPVRPRKRKELAVPEPRRRQRSR